VDLDSDTDSAVSSRWEETDEEKEEEEEEEVSGAATWAESKLALEPRAIRTKPQSVRFGVGCRGCSLLLSSRTATVAIPITPVEPFSLRCSATPSVQESCSCSPSRSQVRSVSCGGKGATLTMSRRRRRGSFSE